MPRPSQPASQTTPDLSVVPWSLPSTFETTRAHHGYRQYTLAGGSRIKDAEWADVLEQFAPIRSAWLSRIDPGGFVVCHIDAGPHYERWQMPVTGYGSLNGVRAVPGQPFQVHHDRWHHVRNDDNGPRIVVVVDRDVIRSPDKTPFRFCSNGPDCRSDHE